MKKVLKIIGYVFLALVLFLLAFYFIKNESLPDGERSLNADYMAAKMTTALNKQAWDSTKTVSWTFRGTNDYIWDRIENKVNVKWGEIEVSLDPETITGDVKVDGKILEGNEAQSLIKKAWDNFNNDSFWLCAPFKVFDPGVERSIITLGDGREGLMVTYSSGGTTPGDTYVWILGEDNKPTSVKMWVSILPIGGMEFTWENYKTLPSGALLAQNHQLYGLINLEIGGIE